MKKEHQVISRVLSDYRQFLNTYSYLDCKLIISQDFSNYLIVLYGLLNGSYYHDFILHLKFDNGKIHVHRDDIDIRSKLIKSGLIRGKLNSYGGYGDPSKIDFAISLEKIYEHHKHILIFDKNHERPQIKPNATAQELFELAQIENKYIISSVAQHPNISFDLFLKLFPKFPAEIFNNPKFNFFLDNKDDFYQTLLNAHPGIFNHKNIEIPEDFINWAVNNENQNIRCYVARGREVPAKYLEKLADDPYCLVIACLNSRYARPSSNPATYFSEEITELIYQRYRQLTKNCTNKYQSEYEYENDCCDCINMLANV